MDWTKTSLGPVETWPVAHCGALSPHDASSAQFTVDGPNLRLSEKQALSLALAINELATNAIKYGALSTPSGHIDIAWSLTEGDGGSFAFTWKEAGGPVVVPPSRKGLGSTLVEPVVPSEFGGTATLTYNPAGLQYHVITGYEHVAEHLQR